MRPRPLLRATAFSVRWDPETRLFYVYVDDKVVGWHRGRGTADQIGRKAVAAARNASPPSLSPWPGLTRPPSKRASAR